MLKISLNMKFHERLQCVLLINEMIEWHAFKKIGIWPSKPHFSQFFGQTPIFSPAMPIYLHMGNGKPSDESIQEQKS